MRDGRICGIHMKSQIALHAAVGALCVFTAGREERYQKSWKAPPLAPWWLSGEELTGGAGYAGDPGLVPGSGRCSGGGNGNPLQYFCTWVGREPPFSPSSSKAPRNSVDKMK